MAEAIKYLYLQIYNDLKKKIIDGVYHNGDQLPTEHELTQQYATSRDTVRKAMSMLTEEYYVVRISAKGTFVRFNPAEHNITKLRSFSEIMTDQTATTESKNIEVVLLDGIEEKIRIALRLSTLYQVYRVNRIRYAGDSLISQETAYIPSHLCPRLDNYIKPHSSLFKLYESVYQHHISESKISIRAELPTPETAEVLGITPFTPILKTCSLGILTNGTPLYYAISCYEGSKYIYKTTMKRYDD